MYIKITKVTSDADWYKPLIGRILEVNFNLNKSCYDITGNSEYSIPIEGAVVITCFEDIINEREVLNFKNSKEMTNFLMGEYLQPKTKDSSMCTEKNDSAIEPAHYGGKDNPYEAIKVIRAWKLNFNLGNTLKYISRAGKKDAIIQDLEKAMWYLNDEINHLKNNL